jgi:ribonucleotide reductase alpha subunit
MVQYTADDFDYTELWRTAYIATINLDHVIDKNYYPTVETKCSNFRNLPIGLGIQGLADTLISMKIPFESDMALRFNRNMMETIYNAALSASKDIAKSRYEDMEYFITNKVDIPEYYDESFKLENEELNTIYHHHRINKCELKLTSHYGAYSSYINSPMWEGKMQHDLWGEEGSVQDWEELREEIAKYGVRNSLLTALMPTASTSQIMGNVECFEWFTSNVFTRSTLAGEFPVVNKYLVNDLLAIGMWDDNMKQHIIAADGSVELLDIPPTYKELYKTMWDIKTSWVIKHARARAPFVDQTQSMNIYMAIPDDSKLIKTLMYAWEQGLKTGAYYVRTKPSGTIKFTVDAAIEKKVKDMNDAECTSCSA